MKTDLKSLYSVVDAVCDNDHPFKLYMPTHSITDAEPTPNGCVTLLNFIQRFNECYKYVPSGRSAGSGMNWYSF